MNYIAPNTDVLVTLTGAQNADDDSYLNAATVAIVVNDLGGTEVISSQSLSYVSSSNGNYKATVDKLVFSAALTQGRQYVALCTVTEGGLDKEFRFKFIYDHNN